MGDEDFCDFADPALIEKLRAIQPSPPLDVRGTIVAEETEVIVGDLPRGTCNGPLFGDTEPVYNATISAILKPDSEGEFIAPDSEDDEDESEDEEDEDDEDEDEQEECDKKEECVDVKKKFNWSKKSNGKFKTKKCSWVKGKLKKNGNFCDKETVEGNLVGEHCPVTCGWCNFCDEDNEDEDDEDEDEDQDEECEDVIRFIWRKKPNGKFKRQNCSWVEGMIEKNEEFCDKKTVEGDLVGEHCPVTCGWCDRR